MGYMESEYGPQSTIVAGWYFVRLVWMVACSNVVGTLSAIGFLVAIIGLGWFFIQIPNPASLELDKWVSFAIVGFAALIYGFVSWRLLVRTRSTAYIKN